MNINSKKTGKRHRKIKYGKGKLASVTAGAESKEIETCNDFYLF